MANLEAFAQLALQDQGLGVLSTLRPDATIQASVINVGVLDHPVTGRSVVGLVARGGSRKLANLRARPQTTVVVHAGHLWVAAEGGAQIAGPDDELAGVEPDRLRLLLRDIFTAAGGIHDDWPTYDRAMAAERRAAVLITPTRIYSNG